jgi:hypothetical protein
LNNRAVALLNSGGDKYGEAIADLDTALSIRANYYYACVNKALILLREDG